jgi:hypothetical protein
VQGERECAGKRRELDANAGQDEKEGDAAETEIDAVDPAALPVASNASRVNNCSFINARLEELASSAPVPSLPAAGAATHSTPPPTLKQQIPPRARRVKIVEKGLCALRILWLRFPVMHRQNNLRIRRVLLLLQVPGLSCKLGIVSQQQGKLNGPKS